MLKYINYQLLDDEEQQKQLERAVAPQISRNIRQNIDAFRQYIPSVLQMLEEHEIQQFSLPFSLIISSRFNFPRK